MASTDAAAPPAPSSEPTPATAAAASAAPHAKPSSRRRPRGGAAAASGAPSARTPAPHVVRVSQSHRVSYFVDLSLRLLRSHARIDVTGAGDSVQAALEVAEGVRRAGFAEYARIRTATISSAAHYGSKRPAVTLALNRIKMPHETSQLHEHTGAAAYAVSTCRRMLTSVSLLSCDSSSERL